MSNAILRGREPELLARASLGGKSLERRRGDNAVERERERKSESGVATIDSEYLRLCVRLLSGLD